MAEQTKAEADKKRLAQEREARVKAAEERAKNRGRPTPTQEELDMINLGNHPELSPDGSPPDPNVSYAHRQSEAQGGYQTRQSTPQPHSRPHSTGSSS